jgi:uncharacterized protein (TIGR03000 family)
MNLEGPQRHFLVPSLQNGKTYDYPIRIELTRDGKTYSVSANQQVKAGNNVQLVCTFGGNSLQLAHKIGQEAGALQIVQQLDNRSQR